MEWVGERIKNRAKEQNISISKLSKLIGVSRRAVNDWIKGQLPKGNHLVALCQMLHVSPNYFFAEMTDEAIIVPVHRTKRKAKVSLSMQGDAIELVKEYALFFKHSPDPELVPSYRGDRRNGNAVVTISKELRHLAGVADADPINYVQAFTLMKQLGINVVFKTFSGALQGSYAFYTKIYQHRVVFVNSDINVLDLIFQLLHEAVHAVRDEVYHSPEYDKEEDAFCDNVANYAQFPDEYIQFVYSAIKEIPNANQVATLKAFGQEYKHALYGLIIRLKESLYPEFSLNIGGADTNIKKEFPTLREVLFAKEDPRFYVAQLATLSPLFVEKLRRQLPTMSSRRLAELLDLESVLDARVVQQELMNLDL